MADTKPTGAMEAYVSSMEGLMQAVLNVIYVDPHQWSERPCQTCRLVSAKSKAPFGCERYRAERAAHKEGEKAMTEKPATPAEIAREIASRAERHHEARECVDPEILAQEAEPILTRRLDSHLAEERAARQRAEADEKEAVGALTALTSILIACGQHKFVVADMNRWLRAHPSGPERAGTGEKIGR